MMIDTAVIPCGGLGTRLHPITRWLPKEMLPVGLKPVLYWTLDEAADAGLLRAIIITNPHKPMLEAVARNYPGPVDLEFVPQDHPRGSGRRPASSPRQSRRLSVHGGSTRQPLPWSESIRRRARHLSGDGAGDGAAGGDRPQGGRLQRRHGPGFRAKGGRWHSPRHGGGGQGGRTLRHGGRRRSGHTDRPDGVLRGSAG